jgi:uncharacterized protein (DUF488 family)
MTTLYTIGHGNRSAEELVQMLKEAGVKCLMDVRSYPGSRAYPHFSRTSLESTLPAQGLHYVWDGEALGGFRKPTANSRHEGLRSDGFRGYADYMETEGFKVGIRALIARAEKSRIAIMCAERLPWRCHRSLISDYLVTQGVSIMHLVAPGKKQEHSVNPIARTCHGELIYDKTTQMRLEL